MPPLRSLRAFEAAARLGSFTRAADELGVTPGAIAQQVHILEDWLGQALFVRKAHGIVRTPTTELVAEQLTEAFDSLSASVQALRAATFPDQIRIATLPSVAQLWLSRRLPHIRQRFPELEISVLALDEAPNFKRELFDLGIFYSSDPPEQTTGRPMFRERLFPVCAPSVELHSLEDLATKTLIHDASWRDDWRRWLSAVGATSIAAHKGPVFSLYSVALQSTLDGDGVLMGRRALVQTHLDEGLLVRPFQAEVAADELFVFLPSGRPVPPAHAQLAEWLRDEADHA